MDTLEALQVADRIYILFYGVGIFALLPITTYDIIKSIQGNTKVLSEAVNIWLSTMWVIVAVGMSITRIVAGDMQWVLFGLTAFLLALYPLTYKAIKQLQADKAAAAGLREHMATGYDWLKYNNHEVREGESVPVAIERHYPGGWVHFMYVCHLRDAADEMDKEQAEAETGKPNAGWKTKFKFFKKEK